ncbi:MAG: Uma2 family endonuclease [Clostridium sp.]
MAIKRLNPRFTLEEFEQLEKDSKETLEFIDGYIYAKSFSSMNHNTIIGNIQAELRRYLRGKPCNVYMEQIEVILGEDRVKPDIFIVCKDEAGGFSKKGQSFLTIPKLIFEVVSKSNARLDTVKKMDLYARAGVEEYNLVYQEGHIHQYKLNEEADCYYLNESYNINDTYKSIVFPEFKEALKIIFEDLE